MPKHTNPDRAPQRALVVDDNALMRVILSSMLIHRGYEVIEEHCSETALTRLKEEAFDLVMLDIMMFSMSGIELCQIIREELELLDLPVVAYTAHTDIFNVAHMRMAGFNDFLFKPVSGEALDGVLQELRAPG
ncbi:MAG: response regulator [Gammaproteobacteria bacterium]|nr:response regulator [Gammaproteobacteria bacterium]MBU1602282.1 response regulator [Gammaproteobacteria bacterium]MBU2433087.1 response regulator [Gammaproteobacteria bacterium]MBU2451001.1 response regulator [Gammaproteobacteria bacterium]